MKPFAKTKTFTPLLNTPLWNEIFHPERLAIEESSGLLRAIESIAFPDTKMWVLESKEGMVKVKTSEYPSNVWIDSRFLEFFSEEPEERKRVLPSKEQILLFLEERVQEKTAYIWGGNRYLGIPELLNWYPPSKPIEPAHPEYLLRFLKGLDCSGLIYEATHGFIPRNTSDLRHFGKPILIEDLTPSEIVSLLEPLDLIVIKGHVVCVGENNTIIESKHRVGVYKSSCLERLEELIQTHTPKNAWDEKALLVRRWI